MLQNDRMTLKRWRVKSDSLSIESLDTQMLVDHSSAEDVGSTLSSLEIFLMGLKNNKMMSYYLSERKFTQINYTSYY